MLPAFGEIENPVEFLMKMRSTPSFARAVEAGRP